LVGHAGRPVAPHLTEFTNLTAASLINTASEVRLRVTVVFVVDEIMLYVSIVRVVTTIKKISLSAEDFGYKILLYVVNLLVI